MPYIYCLKLKKEAAQLDKPPMNGELGERIYQNISVEAWQQWLEKQTILINENRFTPVDPEHRKILQEEMVKFLFEDH